MLPLRFDDICSDDILTLLEEKNPEQKTLNTKPATRRSSFWQISLLLRTHLMGDIIFDL